MPRSKRWPSWWEWELELSPHILKRMLDRRLTELDLREMLERASSCRPAAVEGRWTIETRHRSLNWEVIVEPDPETVTLVVVTAYPLSDA